MTRFHLAVGGMIWVMAISPLGLRADDPPSPFSPELIKLFTPADYPTTEAKAKLGDKLFDDKRLSVDNTVACNTCHVPRNGFTVQI